MPSRSPLIDLLATPQRAPDLSDADWDLLIRQGRAAGLLATVHHLLLEAGLSASIPERPAIQLAAAQRVAERHHELVRWEVEGLYDLMERIGAPLIVLKGAAYVMAGREAARGRMFGDIDIMVPRGALPDVERALGRSGWVQENRDAYDDRYYRQWMHEIPALRHSLRGTILDVHHNILPLTARNRPDAKALWAADIRVAGFTDLYVLSNEDMLLHTASHLFCNGEFDRGLRDLFDFVRLAREFSIDADFWPRVAERARRLDLNRPLALAVRYARHLLAADIPLAAPASAFADALFQRGLMPNHSTARDGWTPAALFALYVRGHYLRMPLQLLLPHLIYKGTLAKVRAERQESENQKNLAALRAFLGK